MANEAAKKRVIKNVAFLRSVKLLILGTNATYLLFRAMLLWGSFSAWHMAGFLLTSAVYAISFFIFSQAAKPSYAPDGSLKDGGLHDLPDDLHAKGMIEYTWDMIVITVLVQALTAFVSDWFWLIYLVPPSIGFYFLWVKVVYPWISTPDALQQAPQDQSRKGRAKFSKMR